MATIGVVVTGASGRMGGALVRALVATNGMSLVGVCDRQDAASVGEDVGHGAGLGELGLVVEDSLEEAIEQARNAAQSAPAGQASSATSAVAPMVVIDFTSAKVSVEHASICARLGVPIVIGSTGFDEAGREKVREASSQIPLVLAPNMSVGVNLMFMLAGKAAAVLGEAYDVEILEAHHRMKADSPSGTALRLGEVVAGALGRNLEEDAVYERFGAIGARSRSEIGIQTIRGGDVVGEHTVFFLGEGERIELTHRATSREIFVKGAIRAAAWLVGRRPGFYEMEDVLGIG